MSSRNSVKQFHCIEFPSPSSCYCCFPHNSWSLRFERSCFFFFSLVQALCHSETLHLLPRKQVWDGETRSQGALLFVNGWRATRTVTEPEITVSLLKQVNRGADLFIRYLCEPFPLRIPREKVLSVQVKSHLHSPDLHKWRKFYKLTNIYFVKALLFYLHHVFTSILSYST